MMIRIEMLIIQAIICFVSAFACRVYIWGARPLWQNWGRWSKYLNLYVYPHIKDIQWQGASCRTADTQILNAFQGQETWRTPMKLQASCGRVIQDPVPTMKLSEGNEHWASAMAWKEDHLDGSNSAHIPATPKWNRARIFLCRETYTQIGTKISNNQKDGNSHRLTVILPLLKWQEMSNIPQDVERQKTKPMSICFQVTQTTTKDLLIRSFKSLCGELATSAVDTILAVHLYPRGTETGWFIRGISPKNVRSSCFCA